MVKDSWILVANSCKAKIYKKDKKTLVEIKQFEHLEGRMHNRDLVDDKPGRDFESVGSARHSLEPHHSPHENEMMIFARELASYLEQARNQNEYERLYIAANPNLLGKLRQVLDSGTAKLIQAEIDKDLTQLKPDEIFNHFLAIH
jgi:protein required for attachment to host cells